MYSKYILRLSFFIALLLHAIAFYLLRLEQVKGQEVANGDRPIEIQPYEEDKKAKPLVQTSRPREQDEDSEVKPRFYAEQRSRTKHETKSPFTGRFRQGAPGSSGAEEGVGEGKPAPGMRDLLPFGSSPNSLPNDIENGTETVLNTDQVLYASFITRIADEIYDPWVEGARGAVKNIYAVGRKLESHVYVTKLDVKLDKGGNVAAIKTLRTSGVRELDEASKKAFWDIEPFPNPPAQMFGKDGLVNLVYEFHFEFKTSSFNIMPDLI